MLSGYDAIQYARAHGLALNKYADPTEPARDDLTPDQAEQVAAEDPGLIWLVVRWTEESIADFAPRPARAAETLDGRHSRPPAPVSEQPAFLGDVSLSDNVDIIRWTGRNLYINGYRSRLSPRFSRGTSMETLAHDVLNVVLDPVPSVLVTPFAVEVIASLGPSFVLHSDAVEAWIRSKAK